MGVVQVMLWDGETKPAQSAREAELHAWYGGLLEQRKRISAGYDGARLDDATKGYWAHADAFDADSAHRRDVRHRLIRHSRYEVANNGLSDGIASTYATDLVGLGPQLRMQSQNNGFNQMVERTFFTWAQAAQFRRKLWTMAHAKHVDGEAFGVIYRDEQINHPIKLNIRLYEAEQCQTPMPTFDDPNYIDGIKFDAFGKPVWFDFLGEHPGKSNRGAGNPLAVTRIEARRVLHWFKMRRPGQHRGVPECASTLNLGAAFRRLREANLSTAEKVAAWTLFFKTMFEPETIQAMPPMSTLEILHGMATTLPNSVEPFQLKAEQPGPSYEQFHKTLANEQGRPKGMPLNKTLCNSADYNYASGRLDHQTYYGYLDVDREDGNDQVLIPFFGWWFDEAISTFGWFGGEPRNVGIFARFHSWDWPRHRVADVEAEANANQTKLKSGQIFPHRLFSDAGLDFEDECEAAAQSYGIGADELKKRLLDSLLPPAQQPQATAATDAAFAVYDRLQRVNGNGAHHG